MNKIDNNNYSSFQTFINNYQANIGNEIQQNIKKNHLGQLKSELTRCFPEWNEVNSVQKIIRNTYGAKVEEAPEYSGMNLEEYWYRRVTLHI